MAPAEDPAKMQLQLEEDSEEDEDPYMACFKPKQQPQQLPEQEEAPLAASKKSRKGCKKVTNESPEEAQRMESYSEATVFRAQSDDEDPYRACFNKKRPAVTAAAEQPPPATAGKDDAPPPDPKPKRGRQPKKTAQLLFIDGG